MKNFKEGEAWNRLGREIKNNQQQKQGSDALHFWSTKSQTLILLILTIWVDSKESDLHLLQDIHQMHHTRHLVSVNCTGSENAR